MNNFIPLAALLIAALVIFLVYVFIRNRKDERKMEKDMNEDYPKHKKHPFENESKD